MYNGIISSSAIEIIAFLMVVGGAFGIMIRTGAVEAGLIGLIRKAKGAEKLLIPVLFVLFSLGGAVFGMGEEALPFTMILCRCSSLSDTTPSLPCLLRTWQHRSASDLPG